MDAIRIRERDAILALKITATVCFGRFSGLVSFTLSQASHPSSSGRRDELTHNRFVVPTSAMMGSLCSFMVYSASNRHYDHYGNRELPWLLIGLIPVGMSLSEPIANYLLRNCSAADWVKYKQFRSILALAVFAYFTTNLALYNH